ncbi:MAG: hypothetical protein K8S99_02630 [Planctomycetes bacterium]|nr:hypothetical protein [Planctomycetota bacterium]
MSSTIVSTDMHRTAVNNITRGLGLLAVLAAIVLGGCAGAPPSEPRMDDVVRQNATITVYPPLCRGDTSTYDRGSAQTIAGFLRQRTSGEVVVSSEEIQGYKPNFGELRPRWQIVADSITEHLRTHPMQTQLGVWAVYSFVPGTDTVSEILVELFDKDGKLTRRFTIDQFNIAPRTAAECTELVMATVKNREAIYADKPSH